MKFPQRISPSSRKTRRALAAISLGVIGYFFCNLPAGIIGVLISPFLVDILGIAIEDHGRHSTCPSFAQIQKEARTIIDEVIRGLEQE